MASKWSLAIVDKFSDHVDRVALVPNKVVEIGRKDTSQYQIQHKYISRLHITLLLEGVGADEHVTVTAFSKNPTFFSEKLRRLAASGETSQPSTGDGSCVSSTRVSRLEAVNASSNFKGGYDAVGPTTLHFPTELHLPRLSILCDLPLAMSAAAPPAIAVPPHSDAGHRETEELSVARMLTVPELGNESDEDDEIPPPPRQLRLLEEAARQQCIANAAAERRQTIHTNYVAPAAVPMVSPAAVAMPKAPSLLEGVPVKREPTKATPAADTTSVALTPPSTKVASNLVDEEESVFIQPRRADVVAPVPKGDAIKPKTTVTPVGGAGSGGMGFWEWKCHTEGDDNDPKNWKKYIKATADILEAAYRKDGVSTVAVDDTYNVCFDDARVGMVQYRKDDPSRWRCVRRRGGEKILRPNVKKKVVVKDTGLTSSSSSDSGALESSRPSWIVSDDDEDDELANIVDDSSDDDYAFDSESSIETPSDDSTSKRKKGKKKAAKLTKPHTKKRGRDED